MKILFLGGTRFVGRHMAEAAIRTGHDVTVFHRGTTGGDSFQGAETILGDRTKDLSTLLDRSWDAVVDSCGYYPAHVASSAEALAGKVERYLFVSSISVYRPKAEPLTEHDPVGEAFEGMSLTEMSPESYGPLKVLCEREVQRVFGDKAIIVRPGLVVGPGDYTDRFTYWPWRIRQGGDVLCADVPELRWQCIDGRDLGEFAIGLLEQGASGVFSDTGPAEPLTMRENLELLRSMLDSDARFVWADMEFLKVQGVGEWSDLPFVLFDPMENLMADVSKGVANGLKFRSAGETVRDLLAWKDAQGSGLATGLSDERQA